MATQQGNVHRSVALSSDMSDNVFEHYCTPCLNTKINTEAIKYCVECGEYYCKKCIVDHSKFAITKGHKLVELNQLVNDSNSALPSIGLPTERCVKHPGELIKMYCPVHTQVECPACLVDNHKSCKNLQYIPDVLDKIYKPETFHVLNTRLHTYYDILKNSRKTYEKAKQYLTTSKRVALQELSELRSEINKILDDLEEKARQEIESQHQPLAAELTVNIEQLDGTIAGLEKCISQLKSCGKNRSQEFVTTKIAQNYISSEVTTIKKLSSGPSNIYLAFSSNVTIKDCLQRLSSLGQITKSVKNFTKKKGLYSVKKTVQCDVRAADDTKVCNISGSCLLESGELVLADYNNNNLKLFDTVTKKVTRFCVLPGKPFAVNPVNPEEVAVSLGSSKMIQFISIGNEMVPTRQLIMEHECCGLAVAENNIYVTDGRHNIYVHSMDGQLLRTMDTNKPKKTIFSRNRHVSVSRDGSKVHVADLKNNKGLITIDAQGQFVWKLSAPKLRGARGVSTDDSGHVFVCGMSSMNVVQLDQDGTLVGQLAIQSNLSPSSMSFDTDNCRLIVTYHSNDKILLCSLE